MDAQTLATVIRGVERVIIVAVAALCISLGYALFQSVPTDHESGGKFEFANAKIVLSKVGPGVFFALFGSLVLWQAVRSQMSAGPVTGTTISSEESRRITYGASSGDTQALRHAQNDIEILNCLA